FCFRSHHFLDLQALGFRTVANILDVLFLFRHVAFNRYALAGDVSNFLTLAFKRFFHAYALDFDRTFTVDVFQLTSLTDAHFLNLHRTFAGFHRHFDLALLVFFGNRQFFIGLDAGGFCASTLLLTYLFSLGGFASLQGFNLAPLTGFCIGLAAFQFQRRFAGGSLLALNLQLLVALQTVGFHVVHRGDFGNPLDAFGVQDVVGVQRRFRRLLQVIDGHVFQHVTVQILTNGLNDRIAEVLALFEQLHELQLLTHSLQRFTELGVEQLVHRIAVRRTTNPDRLGHPQHIFGGFVNPQIESNGDVGTQVVFTDQPFLAGAVQLQSDDRDFHGLGAMNNRQHHGTGKVHLRSRRQVVHDQCLALIDLPIERLEQGQHAQYQQNHNTDGHECRHHPR